MEQRKSEIGDNSLPAPGKNDVFWAQIEMCHPIFMGVFQRPGHLPDHESNVGGFEYSLACAHFFE